MHASDQTAHAVGRAAPHGEGNGFRLSSLGGLDGPEIVAELAHTLRSRLTSILFLAETLYDATPPEEGARKRQLGLLYGSALGVSVFTSNLMELVRGQQADLIGVEPEPICIPELLGRLRDEIAPLAEQRGLPISIRAPAGPDRRGHPLALHRVLLALAVVALEFTDEGIIEFHAGHSEDPLTELAIRAPGALISADALTTLERAVERRQDGTGWSWSPVGVAITTARQICRKMEGGVRVTSNGGRGLDLGVVLPLPV